MTKVSVLRAVLLILSYPHYFTHFAVTCDNVQSVEKSERLLAIVADFADWSEMTLCRDSQQKLDNLAVNVFSSNLTQTRVISDVKCAAMWSVRTETDVFLN